MLSIHKAESEEVGKTPERVGRKYMSKMVAKTLTAQRVGFEKNDEINSPIASSAQAHIKNASVAAAADINDTSA